MRKTIATIATISAISGIAAAAGCSSSTHRAQQSSGASSPQSATSAPMSQYPLPPDSQLANDITKRKAVALTQCGATDGGWGASGTAKNPSSTSAADYKITVYFTTPHATVINFATTKVSVAAGGSQTWAASQKFALPQGTQLVCVLRAIS